MASLAKPAEVWNQAASKGRSARKAEVDGTSLRKCVFALAQQGFSPDQIGAIVSTVYSVRVVNTKGNSSPSEVKKSTIKMWTGWANPRSPDGKGSHNGNGGSLDDIVLPSALIEKVNKAVK